MAAFRKRNATKIEIFASDATHMQLLMVRAVQAIGGPVSGASLENYVDEYIEQGISDDFRDIFGMTFEEMRGRNSTLATILRKQLTRNQLSMHAGRLARAAVGEPDGELSDVGAVALGREDPL